MLFIWRQPRHPRGSSMSTSLLYHGFGIRGYNHVSSDYAGGEVRFRIEQPRETLRCSACGCDEVVLHGCREREFRTLPIGGKPVRVTLPIPRVGCRNCGVVRRVDVPFAEARRTYTRSFERYALELLLHMTILDVARHLDVGWDAVKDIRKRHLQARFGKPRLKNLRRIAIDEISVGHGRRYLTVVLNLVSGAVVFVGDGKGADALKPFWKRLRASKARIEAVATDMSPAYIQAVRENLPKAVHVFDRFHVVKLSDERFSRFRRELQRDAEGTGRKFLKGTRWLILKNPENLDDKKGKRQRLERALADNAPLATVYFMKEEMRQIWEQENRAAASRFLDDWMRRAEASGIKILQQFAATLSMHRTGILAYYDCPISTGPLEGTNNKIRTLQRQAYGYRDQEFFKLRIYALHRTKYALVG